MLFLLCKKSAISTKTQYLEKEISGSVGCGKGFCNRNIYQNLVKIIGSHGIYLFIYLLIQGVPFKKVDYTPEKSF
jgi:hypothetical protein